MALFKRTKSIVIKLDDIREEKVEVFIKDHVLKALDENPKIDALEEKGIVAAITAANLYAATHSLPTCPEDIKVEIAKRTVTILGKINKDLQKQMDKKSKWYQLRHK